MRAFKAIITKQGPPGNRWLFSLLSDLGVGAWAVDTGGALGHFRSAGAGSDTLVSQ
jgi:hypothetical protein